MKYLVTKDGMWLVSYIKCGIGIYTGGQERFAYTGLWSEDIRDAKVFSKAQTAAKVALLTGNATMIAMEEKKDV